MANQDTNDMRSPGTGTVRNDLSSGSRNEKALPGCLSLRHLFPKSLFKSPSSPASNKSELSHSVQPSSNHHPEQWKEKDTSVRYATSCAFGHDPTTEGEDVWRHDQAVGVLPTYVAHGDADIYRPDVLKTIEHALDDANDDLRALSLDIHAHPEIMFEEVYAHDTLTKFMEDRGWEVTRHYKMDTAWRAAFTYKSNNAAHAHKSARVLGVNSEMDALPGIGHACGHNLIAIAGVGVALAVRAALEKHDIPGTVVLLGTPAEEGGQGKATLISKGAYKEMDACVMSHPGPGRPHEAALGPCLALQGIDVEFFGHTAHASAAPWEGINAFDASVLAYNNVSALRQQMPLDHRVQGVIKGPNDLAANVIPDYTRMLWYVRAPSFAQLEKFRERVLNCFKAAALASGCRYELKLHQPALDLRQNIILTRELGRTLKNAFSWDNTAGPGAIGGSTDFGNVTYELPAIHPAYSIPTEPNGGNHTPAFTASAKTVEAHEATMTITKALAHIGFRVLDDDAFFNEVKQSFEKGEKLFTN